MSISVSIRKRLSRSFTLEMEFESSGEGDSPCLGILGASGCGKSMTLKCIAGIETPDEGRIAVNGRVLFDSARKINLRPQARRVGYLFQNYALFPRMTVLENIAAGLPGRERGADKKRKVLAWIDQFGLQGLEDRCPARLSGGQQQRAALARMLIGDPAALLLDEPFSALDANLRERMQMWIRELLKDRGDSILVTHSRDEVYKLCGELLLMDGGRVLKKGGAKEIFENPGLTAAARLTGCRNISPIRIAGDREIYALDWGLSLRTARAVERDATHVGIRAHDFVPVFSGGEGAGGNLIRIKVLDRSAEPFEEAVLFANAEAADSPLRNGTGESGGTGPRGLWWKYSRYLNLPGPPPYLRAPPERLLLLR
ncbi:MAG: ATP-binding cassette domain-containing protein [Treponema sp.]|nr:ATP-binding cassette domain-containing protein [Treponema sp.]